MRRTTPPRFLKRYLQQKGFTFLELLIVVAIIGILAAYVGPRYFSQLDKSETIAAKAQMDVLSKALYSYRLDVGHYPSNEQGLAALVTRPTGESSWNGPYLQKGVPTDPWKQPYSYHIPGKQGDYDLSSLGKDGNEAIEANGTQ